MTEKNKITTAQGFLHAMHPTAPRVITIIHPQKAGTQTFTFSHKARPGSGRHVTRYKSLFCINYSVTPWANLGGHWNPQ